MTHELWANLNAHIFGYLRSVTLAELVAAAAEARRHGAAGPAAASRDAAAPRNAAADA